MWHKVKWLTFWVSMVLWFGNMWGCAASGEEQNYKSTGPERPSQFERYDSSRGDWDKLYAEETAPSLTGLDRSNWPKVTVSPDIGETYHGPVYYTDRSADRSEPVIDFDQPVEAQLEASLAGTRDAGIWDAHHTPQLLLSPLAFAWDSLLLPIRMVQTPPWTVTSTPALPEASAMDVPTPPQPTTPAGPDATPAAPDAAPSPSTPAAP